MEKTASVVVERLNMLDYVNVVFGGACFLGGLYWINPESLAYYIKLMKSLSIVSMAIVIILVSYIIGMFLQTISDVLSGGLKSNLVKNCLAESIVDDGKGLKGSIRKVFYKCFVGNRVIENEVKRMRYIALAKTLFEKNEIGHVFNENDQEDCGYFFAYCEYYNSLNNRNGKTERLREISGLAKILMGCFLILFVIRVVSLLPCFGIMVDGTLLVVQLVCFLLMVVVSANAYARNKLNRLRMVLAVYEVGRDMEGKK